MYYKYLKSLGKLKGVDKPPFSCYTLSINNKEKEKIMKTFQMNDTSGKMNPIRFISAHNGGIQMYSNPGEQVAWAKTSEMIAYALRTKGADDIIMGSSTMDFASEEGFKNDEDATILWDEGYNMYLNEVEAVGVK
jgi:hypothetical protein